MQNFQNKKDNKKIVFFSPGLKRISKLLKIQIYTRNTLEALHPLKRREKGIEERPCIIQKLTIRERI
jgi:hypothetical protein